MPCEDTMESGYEMLKLENQVCFPLYVCSKEIIRKYRPFLDPLGITYTQYITMMALWEKGEMTVKDLGSELHLDSGTLTPLLRKLEEKGFVDRIRDPNDERSVIVKITDEGLALRDKVKHVPEDIGSCIELSPEEGLALFTLLNKLMSTFDKDCEDQD